MTPRGATQKLARRAGILLALWLGFWLLALGLMLGLIAIPLAEMEYRDHVDFAGIAAAIAAVTLAIAVLPRGWYKRKKESDEPSWNEAEAGRLLEFVRDIAKKLGVQAPLRFYLQAQSGASIGAVRNWRGSIKHLNIVIGLPLFAALSERELGAVIAHEFGHFVGGDLKLGPWVYRTRESIGRAVQGLDGSMFFLDAPFRYYGALFLRLSRAVSRAQEYQADALAAQHFGDDAARRALEKVYALGPQWTVYLEGSLWPAVNAGAQVPIVEGFRQFQAGPRSAETETAIAAQKDDPPHPHDTHPSLEERVDALQPGARPDSPAWSGCLHLLGGEAAAESVLYGRLLEKALPVVTWENFGDGVLAPRISERFAETFMDPRQCRFEQLAAMVGDLDGLWPRVSPGGVSFLSPEAKRRHVLGILRDWIVASLVQHGYQLEVRPGAARCLVNDWHRVAPDTLLQDLKSGKANAASLAALIHAPADEDEDTWTLAAPSA